MEDPEHDMLEVNETEDGGLEIKTYLSKSINLTDINSLSSEEREGKTYYTVPLKYGQSVEIYEDPDNAGQYKTDADGYSVYTYGENINVSSNGDISIKTFSADEFSELTPYETELLYAHDDVFSYTYDHQNDSWIRRAQFAFSGPGNPDEWLDSDNHISGKKVVVLSEPIENYNGNIKFYLLDLTKRLAWIYSYDEEQNKMGYLGSAWNPDLIEGNSEIGYFVYESSSTTAKILSAVDKQLRDNNFGKVWYNLLSEYNAEHGTNYPEIS